MGLFKLGPGVLVDTMGLDKIWEAQRLLSLPANWAPKEVAEHLLAIKWIGNSGSHVGELSQKDLLDGFELVEYALEKLYSKNEERLNQMTKEINKRKGPRLSR